MEIVWTLIIALTIYMIGIVIYKRSGYRTGLVSVVVMGLGIGIVFQFPYFILGGLIAIIMFLVAHTLKSVRE